MALDKKLQKALDATPTCPNFRTRAEYFDWMSARHAEQPICQEHCMDPKRPHDKTSERS